MVPPVSRGLRVPRRSRGSLAGSPRAASAVPVEIAGAFGDVAAGPGTAFEGETVARRDIGEHGKPVARDCDLLTAVEGLPHLRRLPVAGVGGEEDFEGADGEV